jgi:hypothetical protein
MMLFNTFGGRMVAPWKGTATRLPGRILVDHVASALPGKAEASLLQRHDDVASVQPRKLGH